MTREGTPTRAAAVAQQTLDEARRRAEAAGRKECPECHGMYADLEKHIQDMHYTAPRPVAAAAPAPDPAAAAAAPAPVVVAPAAAPAPVVAPAAAPAPVVAPPPAAAPKPQPAPAPRPAPTTAPAAGGKAPPRMVIGGTAPQAPRSSGFKMLLGGMPGVGKSTFGVEADDPIFLPADLDEEVVPKEIRYPQPRTWAEACEAVENARELVRGGQRKIGTFVVDVLDALVALCAEHVKKKAEAAYLQDVGGGYNKGRDAVIEEMRTFLMRLDRLRALGVNILILAHCDKGKTALPGLEAYDSWNLSVDPKIAQVVVGWVEVAGFAYLDVTLRRPEVQVGRKTRKGRAVAETGARWVNFVASATALWCKNRKNLTKLPLSYEAFAASFGNAQPEEIEAMIEAIREKLAQLQGVTFRDRAGNERLISEWAEAQITEATAGGADQGPAARAAWLKLLSKAASRLDAKIAEVGALEAEAAGPPDSTSLTDQPPPVDEGDAG
jgi:hypothetical protein